MAIKSLTTKVLIYVETLSPWSQGYTAYLWQVRQSVLTLRVSWQDKQLPIEINENFPHGRVDVPVPP